MSKSTKEIESTSEFVTKPVLPEVLPVNVARFIVWLKVSDEWYFDSSKKLFTQDGWADRTLNQLYELWCSKDQG